MPICNRVRAMTLTVRSQAIQRSSEVKNGAATARKRRKNPGEPAPSVSVARAGWFSGIGMVLTTVPAS